MLITVPWRIDTCTGDGASAMRTSVGPRWPHTAIATVWPVARASSSMQSVASRTGSYCCRPIRPICSASGPRP